MEKNIIQQYSSKNTSINTKKLPRVYNALNIINNSAQHSIR